MSTEEAPLITSVSTDPKTGKKMYEVCDSCNYEMHSCHFCGASLTHSEHDYGGNHHTAEFCRPDLFPHEPGDTCTWPETDTRKPPQAWCYYDHDKEAGE